MIVMIVGGGGCIVALPHVLNVLHCMLEVFPAQSGENLTTTVALSWSLRDFLGGNLISVLGPYGWELLPLSEHPLSLKLVPLLGLNVVCNAFCFSAKHSICTIVHPATPSRGNGGREDVGNQVDICNNQVEDNREAKNNEKEICNGKEWQVH